MRNRFFLVAIATISVMLFIQNSYKELPHTASIKKVKEGWKVTERHGREVTVKIYECWPICETPISK